MASSTPGLHLCIELDDLDTLSQRLEGRTLGQLLDRHPLLQLRPTRPPTPSAIAALARQLGNPRPYPRGRMRTVDADGIIGDFSAPALPDDGRPRTAAFIESLHLDVLEDGLAAYGILHSREVPAGAVMRWVDLHAAFNTLPEALKAELSNARATHLPRATEEQPQPMGTVMPLFVCHPRTGRTLLLPPNRRDSLLDGVVGAEGRAHVAALWAAIEQSSVRHENELHSNEVWIWDNLALAHDNPAFVRDRPRAVWFLNVPASQSSRRRPTSKIES